ncbi:MAG: hypothetical protein GC171_06910 [Terrimonas sp.]|nr:hypothetical protein [Terrimonas sp.]
MKDNKSLLLILLSAGLIGTWIYHLYDKSNYASVNPNRIVIAADTLAIISRVRDSLENLLAGSSFTAVNNTGGDVDSLKGELSVKLKEINSLKRQIGNILRKENLSKSDLKNARDLIRDLRYKIDDMREQNTDLEDERLRLTGVMSQLNGQIDSMELNLKKLDDENKKLAKQVNDASIFVASEINLQAVNIRSGNNEIPVKTARKAKKLIVSFTVQNNAFSFPNAELTVVVKDPSGKTIMEDVWGSGSFTSKTDGKIEYTRKIRFDYSKGDSKNLIFSLSPQDFSAGTYQLLIFHNGIRIGKTMLGLS